MPHGVETEMGHTLLRITMAILALLSVCGSAIAEPACPDRGSTLPPMQLPHLRKALLTDSQILIVSLGSSSTAGAMASDLAHSYPAILQAALAAAWPAEHVAVINRGIGGQDAPEELTRLQTDVIAVRPQLVIWQVGANGALRDADAAGFARMVTAGVNRLKAEGMDVILMDNQRAPRIVAAADHLALEASLEQIATRTDVNLFSRGRLMDAWSQAGVPAATFIAADGLHHNDLGYRCVAMALAEQIAASVRAPVSVAARR